MPFAPTHSTSDYPQEWKIWQELPRPRVVRLQRGQGFWITIIFAAVVAVLIALLGSLSTEWRAHPPKQMMSFDFWSALPFLAGATFFLLIIPLFLGRTRRLVSCGEIAIGKVIGVRLGPRRKRRVIYEFLDRSGRLITASCPDNTRSFSEGVAIPVFFNPENPERDQIALCGSPYEVVLVRDAKTE